jgi:hypothetical protein
VQFDLGDAVRLQVTADHPDLCSAVIRQMDPYPPHADGGDWVPSVRIDLDPGGPMRELQHRAGDGLVSGWDGTTLFALAGERRASVPDAVRDEPTVIQVQPGYPLGRHFRNVVRPALQLRALAGSTVAIHAAAVDTDDGAILVAGWSESGKTETALALAEGGHRFLSDKWTLVTADGPRAIGFPIGVGVRRWVLPYLPRLRSGLPRRARVQLAAATAAAVVSAPARTLRRAGTGGFLAESADRAVALADRAALTPSELARIYGHDPILHPRPVKLLVALRSVPATEVRAVEPDLERLATRMAITASAERQTYWAYHERAAYAAATVDSGRADVVATETRLIRELLDRVPSIEIEAPFPIDPRRVVAVLEPWLTSR